MEKTKDLLFIRKIPGGIEACCDIDGAKEQHAVVEALSRMFVDSEELRETVMLAVTIYFRDHERLKMESDAERFDFNELLKHKGED